MPEQATVELHPAWQWDCDACGREVFERTMTQQLTAEEVRELAERMGEEVVGELPPDDERGEVVHLPDEVECPHCGAIFATEIPE
jgi:ribosomal protein S27E